MEALFWIFFIPFCIIISILTFVVCKLVSELRRERRTNVEVPEIAPWVVHGDRGDSDSDVVQG